MSLNEENLEEYGVWVKKTAHESDKEPEVLKPESVSNVSKKTINEIDSDNLASESIVSPLSLNEKNNESEDFDANAILDNQEELTIDSENDFSNNSEIDEAPTDTDVPESVDDSIPLDIFDDINTIDKEPKEAIADKKIEDAPLSDDTSEVELSDFMDDSSMDKPADAPLSDDTSEVELSDFMDVKTEDSSENIDIDSFIEPEKKVAEPIVDEPLIDMDLDFDDDFSVDMETEKEDTTDDLPEDDETESIVDDSEFDDLFEKETPNTTIEDSNNLANSDFDQVTDYDDLLNSMDTPDEKNEQFNALVDTDKTADTTNQTYNLRAIADEDLNNQKVMDQKDLISEQNKVNPTIEKEENIHHPTDETINNDVSAISNDLLQNIMKELSGLRNDFSSLRTELDELKQSKEVASEPEIEPDLAKTTDKSPEKEEALDEVGFFGNQEDDDTIALSGDELDNILSSASFAQKQEVNKTSDNEDKNESSFYSNEDVSEEIVPPVLTIEENELEEPVIDDISFDDEEIENDLPDEITIPVAEDLVVDSSSVDFLDESPQSQEDSNSFTEPDSETVQEASFLVDNDDLIDENIDDIFGESKTEPNFEKETIIEDEIEELDDLEDSNEKYEDLEDELASSEVFEEDDEPIEEAVTEETLIDDTEEDDTTEETLIDDAEEDDTTEETLIDNAEEDNTTEETYGEANFTDTIEQTDVSNILSVDSEDIPSTSSEDITSVANENTLEETGEEPIESVFGGNQWENEPEIEKVAEDLINKSSTTEESETVSVEKPESVSEVIPNEMRDEIKSVLSYMDQMLENLPEDKIAEFAHSKYFDTYKKLFNELGLS